MSSNDSGGTFRRYGSSSERKRSSQRGANLNLKVVQVQPTGSYKTADTHPPSAPGSIRESYKTANDPSNKGTLRESHRNNYPFYAHESKIPWGEDVGPKDPQHRGIKNLRGFAAVQKRQEYEVMKEQKHPLDGFELLRSFYRSVWPGVVWHDGVLRKPKRTFRFPNGQLKQIGEDINVVVRVVKPDECGEVFLNLMNNEDRMMNKLDHRFILKSLSKPIDIQTHPILIKGHVFPKCGKDLEHFTRKPPEGTVSEWRSWIPLWLPRNRLAENKVQLYMSQVAEALS